MKSLVKIFLTFLLIYSILPTEIYSYHQKGNEMYEISPEFFVHHNLITTEPNRDNHTENSILFLAEYCLLFKEKYGYLPFSRSEIKKTIEFFLIEDGHFVAHPDNFDESKENPWSHDNHTGAMSLSYMYNLDFHKKLNYRYWIYRTQPWNIVYYLNLKSPIFRFLMPILWIKCVSGVINFTDNDKTETGGKIVAYLKMGTLGMKWTRKLCEWILGKNTQFKSYRDVFNYYFKHENHPNRKIWEVK